MLFRSHGVKLADGRPVTAELVRAIEAEELAGLRELMGAEAYDAGRFQEAAEIFDTVTLADEFTEFLTIPAYERLD